MIVRWLQIRGRVRPWMAAVALAAGASASGCSRSSSGSEAAACGTPKLEIADPCTQDDECRSRFGKGWYCRDEATQVMDTCGREVSWGRLCAADGEAPSQSERIAQARTGAGPNPRDDGVVGRAYGPRSLADQLRAEAPSVTWIGVEPIRGPGKLEANELLEQLDEALLRTRLEYMGILHRDASLEGTVVLRLIVGADGKPDVRLESADEALASAGLTELLVEGIRATEFPGKSLTGGECSFRLRVEFASSASGAES